MIAQAFPQSGDGMEQEILQMLLQMLWGKVWAMPAAILVAVMLWGLANCLIGYGIFRISMVITAMIAGVCGGMYLVLKLKAGACITGIDYLVACSVVALLAGLVAWFLYRLCFAIMVAVSVTLIMVYLVMQNDGSVGVWIISGMVGLAAGGIALLFPRIMIILITSIAGAAVATAAVVLIIVGGEAQKFVALVKDGDIQFQAWLAIGIAAALFVAGVCVQALVVRNVRLVWASPPDKKKKKKQNASSSRKK